MPVVVRIAFGGVGNSAQRSLFETIKKTGRVNSIIHRVEERICTALCYVVCLKQCVCCRTE